MLTLRGSLIYPKGEVTLGGLTLKGKLHMPPYESAVGSMADSPVATALLGERASRPLRRKIKASLVAGGTPRHSASLGLVASPWVATTREGRPLSQWEASQGKPGTGPVFLLKQLCHRHIAEAVG